MATLADNWFITPLFDVEYKSYQVLEYVKNFKTHLEQKALFPYFDDLLHQIETLESFERAKNNLDKNLIEQNSNPHNGGDMPHESISNLNEILCFAKKHFLKCRYEAENVLAELISNLHISQMGLVNPSAYGGLVLINQNKETRIYTYEHRLVKRPNTIFQYKDVKTSFAKTVPLCASNNLYSLKWDLLKENKYRSGINTYVVECDEDIPHFASLMPMVKNHLKANSSSPLC